jgi:hypothetical protein
LLQKTKEFAVPRQPEQRLKFGANGRKEPAVGSFCKARQSLPTKALGSVAPVRGVVAGAGGIQEVDALPYWHGSTRIYAWTPLDRWSMIVSLEIWDKLSAAHNTTLVR